MPHNIERSAFRKGEYIGYGKRGLYRITRYMDGWRAECREDGTVYVGSTLAVIGKKINER